MTNRISTLVDQMSLAEKTLFLAGADMWHTVANDRLGIPAMKVTDGPNGARGNGMLGTGTPTACIPSGSSLGATWDVGLLERLGSLLGEEARAKRAHVLLAPTINLHRSPKGGRNFECYSEDPFLTGKLAAGFIRGVQSHGVATTAKHFVANDSEFERNTIDSQIDERTLREVALLPFELAVKEGGAWGLMTAYNRLNGTYCAEHEWLLATVLGDDWGFDGFVVTDWFAAGSTSGSVTAGCTLEMPGPGRFYGPALHAAVESGDVAEADVDRLVTDLLVVMERTGALDGKPDSAEPEDTLDDDAHRALIREAAVAGSVLLRNDGILPLSAESIGSVAVLGPNALAIKVMGGGSAKVRAYRQVSPLDALTARLPIADVRYEKGCDIDRSTPALQRPLLRGSLTVDYVNGHDLDSPIVATREVEHLELLAFGSPVDGVDGEAWGCRVSGTLRAESTGVHEVRLVQSGRARVLLGDEVIIDATEGDIPRGDSYFGMGSIELSAPVHLEAGVDVAVQVEFTNRDSVILSGATIGVVSQVEEDLMGRAVALAASCDLAIVIVGTNDDWETEGRDRDLWELPGDQPELIRRVAEANPRTVVVLNVGAPHSLDWIDDPAAVLSVGFGGQELGEAVVDMLLGDAEPGGRAATTVAAHYEQFAAYPNYPGENSVVRYGEGVFCGHRWHDTMHIDPVVPFGFGLGYTTFAFGDPVVADEAAPGESVLVEVELTNTGQRAGSEVVQVYVEPLDPGVIRPVRELKGFTKVHIEAGESKVAAVRLEPRAFAYFDPGDHQWEELQASAAVPVGGGSIHRIDPGWYVEPGRYRIVVGRSSRDPAGDATLTLIGDAARLSL